MNCQGSRVEGQVSSVKRREAGDDSFLSHFPGLAVTLFVSLAVASENTQMVQGSGFTVNGYFFQQLYRAD